jgi:hypothetical protein
MNKEKKEKIVAEWSNALETGEELEANNWLVAVEHELGNEVFGFGTKKRAKFFQKQVEKDGFRTLIAKNKE